MTEVSSVGDGQLAPLAPKRKRDWRKCETRQRTHLVGVRFDDDEYAAVRDHAAELGVSIPSLVRQALKYARSQRGLSCH